MRVRVLAFAGLAARLGWREKLLEDVEQGTSVSGLIERLADECPVLASYPFTVAVNGAYSMDRAGGSEPGDDLHDGAEVALIPPVSGG